MAVKEELASPLKSEQLQSEVGYHLKRAYVHVIEYFHEYMSALKLRPGEFSILCMIEENQDVTARVLSGALNIAPPNLVSLLESLDERGLIKKTINEQDRRSQFLTLTHQGKGLLNKAKEASKYAQRDGLANLTSQETAQLIKLLQKLYY